MLRKFDSQTEFTGYVDADRSRHAADFFVLAVPALGLIYERHRDDTHIAWLSSQGGVDSLRTLATSAGHHVLDFAAL